MFPPESVFGENRRFYIADDTCGETDTRTCAIFSVEKIQPELVFYQPTIRNFCHALAGGRTRVEADLSKEAEHEVKCGRCRVHSAGLNMNIQRDETALSQREVFWDAGSI